MKALISLGTFFYCIVGLIAQNNIVQYEYWFDNDFANASVVNTTPTAQLQLASNIQTNGLTSGIHTFNFRTKDSQGRYSSVLSQFFYKTPETYSANNNLVQYEYWFDNDYANAQTATTSNASQVNINTLIDAQSLLSGIHTFHIRFKDAAGMWSSVLSQFFNKTPESNFINNNFVQYEYWFDSDYTNVQTIATNNASQVNINTLIDAQSLLSGIHTFHIRFKDDAGMWSSVLSQFFYKTPETYTANNSLVEYEYWFDNDYANAQTATTSNASQVNINTLIDAQTLVSGIHTFHIRFKDDAGMWSSVLSQFVYKTMNANNENPLVTAYRYWLNDDFQNATLVELTAPTQQVIVAENLDFTMIPKNEYAIHFQFRDNSGLWSSVTTDSIIKTPLPIPIFSADTALFCDAGTVNFINNSIDGDSYLWDFGDGNSSTEINPIHTYNEPGFYNVTLTVYDDILPSDSTATINQMVVVHETPDPTISLSGPTNICEGDDVQLSATAGYNYLWSTGSDEPSINVSSSGTYSVTVFNVSFAACSAISEDVNVEVAPLPEAQFSFSNNDYLVSFANNSNNSDNYFWNFGDGNTSDLENPTHTYGSADLFNVFLVASNWCGSDTLFAFVDLVYLSSAEMEQNYGFILYPNPSIGVFNFHSTFVGQEYLVIDMQGRTIRKGIIVFEEEQFDLSNEQSGAYFLVIDNKVIKMVKQ
jgi:PKD repeat protein